MNDPVSNGSGDRAARVGMILAGVGSAAAGVLNVIWREFEPAHQPIQAWGDHIGDIPMLVHLGAAWLILGGVALTIRRTGRAGAASLAILYGMFSLFPLPRLYTAPHFLGHHVSVYIGLLVGVCQQIILFVGTAVMWTYLSNSGPRSPLWGRLARWAFGLSSIDFGLAHLTGVQAVTRMVPTWMPLSGELWTVMTGISFVAAGLSILSGILDVLAARLLGLMLLIFSTTVLTPGIFANPHSHVAWGGDAYNVTAVGATWMFASWLAHRAPRVRNDRIAASTASSIAGRAWTAKNSASDSP